MPSVARGEGSTSLDLTVFSQGDDGGDPHKAEGLDYYGLRVASRVRVSDEVELRASVAAAVLANEDAAPAPRTVTGVTITSASSTTVTLDATAAVDVRPAGSGTTLSAGAFYHHQFGFIGGGLDLGVAQELAGGDTVLDASFSLRGAGLKLRMWDGQYLGWTYQSTYNLALSVTQTVSPSVVVAVGAQYSRHWGTLAETFNFVVLHDPTGTPRELVNEALPDERHRGQVNARVRFTPSVGTSIGLDASFYGDDWGVLHGAAEPSVETTLPWDLRLRVWGRVSWQRASRYFDDGAQEPVRYATQDPDLGNFVMLSPGVLVIVPLGASSEELSWETRVAVFGFYRTDQIYAVGSSAGVVATW